MSAAVLDIATKQRLAAGERRRSQKSTSFLRKAALLETVRPVGAEVVGRLIDDLLADRGNWEYDQRGNPL